MVTSPNDQDPPGEAQSLEAFYDLIYEKFPWLEELDAKLFHDVGHKGQGVEEVLEFVIDQAYAKGREDAQGDMGEYINHLEQEIAMRGEKTS